MRVNLRLEPGAGLRAKVRRHEVEYSLRRCRYLLFLMFQLQNSIGVTPAAPARKGHALLVGRGRPLPRQTPAAVSQETFTLVTPAPTSTHAPATAFATSSVAAWRMVDAGPCAASGRATLEAAELRHKPCVVERL